jgi:hypothetical protein
VVFSTNKTDCHDITEILLKVALNCKHHNPPTLLFGVYFLINYGVSKLIKIKKGTADHSFWLLVILMKKNKQKLIGF